MVTGLPCPGCGLTHAVLDLLQGRWADAFAAHAFAPLFLMLLVLVLAAAVLPEPWRGNLVRTVARLENRTAAGFVFGGALMLYWCQRTW